MSEEEQISLLPLENGVITIGDLWDARNSRRVGFNLFGNNITQQEPESKSLGDLLEITPSNEVGAYVFKHVKDSSDNANKFGLGAQITCELLGGLIKVTGGFDFEVGWSKGMSTEECICTIERPKHLIRLKSNGYEVAQNYYDEHVKKLLEEAKLPLATHVVTQIDIGGSLTSSIKVTQKKTGDQYKVGFFIKGEADLFALTGKMDANASVGEDIKITNYDSKIKLVCMPPIPPPTSEKDFYNKNDPENPDPDPENMTVDKNFAAALLQEKYFKYWTNLDPNNPTELIGIPIKFTLSPIDRYFPPENPEPPPEGDNKKSKLSADDPDIKTFEEHLCTFRDWAGTDYMKRRIMQKLKRIQKILHEPKHVLTIDTVEKEVELREIAEKERLDGLKLYTAWKQELFQVGIPEENEFRDIVTRLTGIIDDQEKEGKIDVFINEMITRSKEELDAVNITTPAIREEEGEEEEQEFASEEKSPLIYFTSQTELTAWQKTQRFCKLLYSAYLREEGAPPPEGESIPQRIYGMSERLGTVYIQPAIAYPTLSQEIARERNKFRAEDQELFSINTPNGTISYSRSDEDLVKIHFILDLLTALTGMEGEVGKFSRMGHLYITYCELHGIKLNISHTIDVIPLIRLLQGMFGSLAITHTLTSTKNEIGKRESFTLIFTQDGVQSSRHVVYALLQLGQTTPNLKNGDVLCATFDLMEYPDVPPLLLSWDKDVKGVCLDHLDILVLLDLYKNEGKWDVEKIVKYLGMGQIFQSPLCTQDRVLFSKHVQEISNFSTRTVSNKELNPLIDILTSVLTATVQGPKDLVNTVTRYAIKLLDEDYSPEDIPHWNPVPEDYIIEIGNSAAWGEIATKLDMIWSSKAKFAYYSALFQLFGQFQIYASPIPVPDIIEDEEDEIPDGLEEGEEPPILIPEEQYTLLYTTLLVPFKDDVGETLEVEINQIHGLRTLHWKGCARLYATALSREVGRLEQRIGDDEHQEKATKIQIVKHLKGIVSEIQSSERVPDHLCHALLEFTASLEIPETPGEDPPENQKYPPEISYRLRTALKLKRYYHMLSDLVENTPEKFEIQQLSQFQLEMYRLVSITDWLNLIRLIQEISTFKQATLAQIWSNIKFQYLIYANLENELVLRALAKAFVDKGQNTVPKYIPRDIAKKILSINLSPEGNPIGFEPIWTSKAVLIKSLQILWVLKVVPEQFQLYLLRNTVAVDGIVYQALKDVGALLYWNEENKYFDQVWDLATIYEAILRLMGQYDTKLVKNVCNKALGMQPFHHTKSTVVISPTRTRTEIITVSQFLTMMKSPPAENRPDLESKIMRLLYHLKLMKMGSLEGSYNPFVLTERVDTLTHLLSRAEAPLQTELLTIISAKFGSQFAIPLTICNSTSPLTFISFTNLLLLEPYKSAQLPKIITAIRIGPNTPEGKSHFLNSMCTLNPAAFACKSNSTPGDTPQYLEGFVDVIKINESTANPDFLNVLFRNGKPDEFYVLNVHGDALKKPQHLKFIQTVTSAFVVFWNPQNWSSIIDKKQELLTLIKPTHATVHLYIDPTQDTIEEIEQSEIIRKPFATPTPENLNNGGKAIATALLRRPKQPNLSNNADLTPAITFPTKHPVAVDMASWIHTISTKVIKSSLILQHGWKNSKTEAELDSHWISDPFYATLITKLVQILQHSEEEYPIILSDLAELLTSPTGNEDMTTTAWKNLGSLTHQEFGHTSFGAVTPTTVTKRQHLLGYLQNDIDTARLNITDLLTELCKVYELSPSKLPFNPVLVMTTLFQSNYSALPVPSVPSAGFFTEKWSQEFISNLENTSVFVLNCVGTDAFQISQVVNSIFGISFTSSSSRSEWSETPWSGLFMRLITLSDEITDQTGIRSILLLHAKPLCATTANGHPTMTQRDQQLSTFLLATSNLSLIFDFDPTSLEYSAILETSLIALNKVDIDEKTPRLFFIGLTVPQLGGSKILTMLNRTKHMAESWIDYGDISTLGHRVILSAIQDVKGNPGGVIFDLTLYPTLIPLSDAIITAVTNLKDECPKLPDFLTELGPIWTHIRDKVPFPHPNFDEMTRSEKFYAALHELLNLIDDAFTFHVEDFPTSIFSEMSNIINAWATGEAGEVSVPTKKEILWSKVSAYVNQMWEYCEMNEEKEPCIACTEKNLKQEEILREWPPWGKVEDEPEPDTQFTQLKFQQLVEEYISWERWHYVNLAKEMMTAFEMILLAQEDETYIEEEDDPEFSPVQKVSLEVKIVDSERRLRQEMDSLFPGVDMAWDENKDDFDYLQTTPAFADSGNPYMDEVEAQKLRDLLFNLPSIEVKLGGFVGIYQGGMVRRTMSKVGTAAVLKFEQEVGKKIINNFRLKVVSHTVWRLNKILNRSQIWWKRDHDPLVIYLASLPESRLKNIVTCKSN